MIKSCTNRYFVKELDTGYVVIGDHQYFKGYTLFLCKKHITELHFLDEEFRRRFLFEMSIVGEAVYNAFKPDKINYELLGNGDAHLHWHIFARRDGDGDVKGPVWWTDKNKMYSEAAIPSEEELMVLKEKLLSELEKLVF
ncbi:HIT family protein [Clostridium sp. D2Q-14]|nr:HIT family protein [Anaeromonas gelatinilytica]